MLTMSKYAFIMKLLDRYANITDNPKPKYVDDTIETMKFLLKNKINITERQERIINDILIECTNFKLNS